MARCDGDEVCGLGADIVCIGGNHNELMVCNPNIVLRAYFAGLQKELQLHAEPCQTGGRTAAPGMELVMEPQRASTGRRRHKNVAPFGSASPFTASPQCRGRPEVEAERGGARGGGSRRGAVGSSGGGSL
jgi:hypothetical protein